jgi:hypothetical protein
MPLVSDNVVSIRTGKPYIQSEDADPNVAAFIAAIQAACKEHGLPLVRLDVPGGWNALNGADYVNIEIVGAPEVRRRRGLSSGYSA